jgi:uncharacterized protein (DUF1015 family)
VEVRRDCATLRRVSTLRPFRALRPSAGLARSVASPPYDVVSSAEARALRKGNDHSFLRVSRPEVDLPAEVDEHADEVYAHGAVALAELLANGTLHEDATPKLWLYGQRLGDHRQVGIVGLASVEEYDTNVIRKHEKTRPDKEDDRTRHIDTLGAHDEPVFLTYRADDAIDEIVAQIAADAPLEDFETDDGVQHTLWSISDKDGAILVEAFRTRVPHLYVADGHHRSAAASRVHAARVARGEGSQGSEGEHDAFLVVVFPHRQMQILPYNRVVRDEQRRSPEALLAVLRERFDVTEASSPESPAKGTFSAFLGGRWYHAAVRAGSFDAADPVASLDCSLVQDQLLAPVFGILDPRRDARIDFVGGIRGTGEIERRVREDGFHLGLVLFPTSIDELLAVSDRDLLMPPKSTWFEPKLRSGLFSHRFSPAPTNPSAE